MRSGETGGESVRIQAENRIKLKREVERILHSPGMKLYRTSSESMARLPLELAVIIDSSLAKEEASETVGELAAVLKSFGEAFRNVRVNVLWWKTEQEIVQQICPLAALQMSSLFETYEKNEEEKTADYLTAYMRKFQARSKIVFLAASENTWKVECPEEVRCQMQPMLHRKWLILQEEKLYRLSAEGRQEPI